MTRLNKYYTKKIQQILRDLRYSHSKNREEKIRFLIDYFQNTENIESFNHHILTYLFAQIKKT